MAHRQQLRFIELVGKFFVEAQRSSASPYKIVEIGSFDVNGSPREFLQDATTEYTGVDLCEGKGVDVVSFGHTLALESASVDFVLSCECFEHDPHWVETFRNMHRMAKPGGIVAFTCASTGRIEHGTTRTNADHSPGTQFVGLDYYRNLTEHDFSTKLDLHEMFDGHLFFYERSSFDLYFVAQKRGGRKLDVDVERFSKEVSDIRKLARLRLKPIEIPIGVARRTMPEEKFQEFSVAYLRMVRPFRRYLKGLFRG
jgi:SAM-dependent methyltransferase